jgi:ABC-2 type transport system ATP-binding protein
MDVEGRRGFWAAIRQDAEQGRTVLFATHYLEEADSYADRIILLRHGEVVADGTAAEIKALTAGRTIRATLADADAAALRGLPGADGVELRGDTVLIHASDSDQLVHAPQLGGSFDLMWVVNAVAWLVIFAAGAVWRFRADTKRV